jgi:hypothetical protein
MNLVEIAAITLIMAGGLGLAYGSISSNKNIRGGASGPVGKCQGTCRTGTGGFAAGALIRAMQRQCAGEQTAARDGSRMLLTAYDRTANLPFLE